MVDKKTGRQIFWTYFVYFLCMLAFCVVRIVSDRNLIAFDNYYEKETFYTFLIQICIMIVLPSVLIWLILGQGPKKLMQKAKVRAINFKSILICLVIGVIAFFLNIAVASLFGGIISFTGYEPAVGLGDGLAHDYSMGAFWFEVVMTAILPAICEEYMHRGLLLYEVRGIGIKKAIIISSLLFGLLHFSIDKVFYTMILGMLIAFVAVTTRSIVPAIIIHFVNNFLNVYLEFAAVKNWVGGKFYDWLNNFLTSTNTMLTFLACFIFLIIVVVLLIYLIAKLFKYTTLNSVDKAIEQVYKNNQVPDDNSPIRVESSKVIEEMLVTNCTLNTDFDYVQNPIDMVLPIDKKRGKITWIYSVFLYASITLGVLVTLSTYIWGFF